MSYLRSKILSLILIAFLVTIFTIIYYPLTIDFNTFNPFWNGYEIIVNELNALVLTSNFKLPKNPQNYVLILVPYVKPSENTINEIIRFVSNGGLLILMDDFGYGNHILRYFTNKVRFTQGLLIDPLFHYKVSELPKISNFEGILTGLEYIYFNYGTALEVKGDVKVLAWSSSFSYLDSNFNSVYDEGEKKGPLPVIASFQYGKGYVVIIADPSISINSMIYLGNNLDLLKKLVNERKVIIDQTLIRKNIHLELKVFFIKIAEFLSVKPILTIVIISLVLSIAFITIRREGYVSS